MSRAFVSMIIMVFITLVILPVVSGTLRFQITGDGYIGITIIIATTCIVSAIESKNK